MCEWAVHDVCVGDTLSLPESDVVTTRRFSLPLVCLPRRAVPQKCGDTVLASRSDVVGWAYALADIAAKLGAATIEGLGEAQREAMVEATAEVAHAALVLERAFGIEPPSPND